MAVLVSVYPVLAVGKPFHKPATKRTRGATRWRKRKGPPRGVDRVVRGVVRGRLLNGSPLAGLRRSRRSAPSRPPAKPRPVQGRAPNEGRSAALLPWAQPPMRRWLERP